ncbi:MAG: major capsid protein [Microviridae sp.]|nr:MAG: major capsid protein [Microviridae sp.]
MANKLFNTVKVSSPDSNMFDLTHDVKMTMQMGNLVPILNMECLPGDKINLSSESLIRLAPLLAPVYQRMDVYTHYFFVPNRILWDNWEKFITDAATTIAPPVYSWNTTTDPEVKKYYDYFGVPPTSESALRFLNAFPFAAYQCIYNEYYRDQNLIAPINYKLVDGNNVNPALGILRNRAWEHDYFTSALPFAQKGDAVDIPLGTIQDNALVKSNSSANQTITSSPNNQNIQADGSVFTPFPNTLFAATEGIELEPTTINDLRRAFKLQEWLEKNARGGTRYVESILAHFGVKSSDARLQRPEYITGSKSPIVISEVLNTTGIDGELPQGNMAGHGISVAGGNQGTYYCEEHGFIIGIMSVLPKPAYSQGVPKHFLKKHPLDYYWPSFANIGEQEITNLEIYNDNIAFDDDTFGYTPRYAEYKYLQSRIAGDFRTSLDYWTLSRKFATPPNLNQEFIECTPEQTQRIFAVQDGTDPLYVQVVNKIYARRKMPVYGTPTF